jgi:hypothetical protein
MKIEWAPLKNELAMWRRDKLQLPIWWRDDDAITATPALDRLARISTDVGVPVHVAVIPGLLTLSLPPMIQEHAQLIPIIHGWRHISHAPQGAKNAEFGHPRAEAARELEHALAKLQEHFGPQLLKLFVPPWNRIAPDFLPELARAGYSGLSTYGPRNAESATSGVMQINTHIDPIFWRGHRGLVDPDTLIADIVTTLRDRREGRDDTTEPLGLLTHHLVHTEDVWNFSAEIIQVLLDGGATPADLGSLL